MVSYQRETVLPCAVSKCNNESSVLCYCCQNNYCLRHLLEHNDLFNPQLNLLFNEVNNFDEEFRILNIRQIYRNCRDKLEQWRIDSHLTIDRFYEEKCHELERFIDEKFKHKRMEITRLQSKISEIIREQEIDNQELNSLKLTIDDLRTEMNNIRQLHNQITVHALVINNNLIDFETSNEHKVDLSILSPIYQTINHPHANDGLLANNDQFMLIYLIPNLILIDKQINIIKQISWPHDKIRDMCWSSILHRFVIIEQNNIYLVDDRTMFIEIFRMIEKRRWSLCTCSDKSLFLSVNERNPSIVEFNLLPSIKFVKQWESPFLCRKDEQIDDIVYNNSTIALIITNKIERSVRMELRLPETFECCWLFRFDINHNPNKSFHCCSINSNEWLITDYQNQRLIHISKDGELKTMIRYNAIPYHVVSFGSNILAIARNNGINFHQL